jgi:hypothetical protein
MTQIATEKKREYIYGICDWDASTFFVAERDGTGSAFKLCETVGLRQAKEIAQALGFKAKNKPLAQRVDKGDSQ